MPTDRFVRARAAAKALGKAAPQRLGFMDRRVLLTGEPSVLASENGRLCFLDALRLHLGMCSHVDVVVPPGLDALLAEVVALAGHMSEAGQVRFVGDSPAEYDAILSVGVTARSELPWTVVNSNGWLARVSSGGTHLAPSAERVNAIGAFAAACLGTAEVFKRLVDLRADRGALLDHLTFSLDSYRAGEEDTGPDLPEEIHLDALLVGAGAIGNGIVLLLRQLPCVGRVAVVDGQAYEPPNLGTCVLIGPSDLGRGKAEALAQILEGRIRTSFYRARLSELASRLWTEAPPPSVVMSAVDSITSRHEVQDLWPDLVIDGAVGEFLAQASRHPWGPDIGCLRCVFREESGAAAEQIQAAATGLRLERLSAPDSLVTEADITLAAPDQRAWLGERVGKSVCSVVEEGVLRMISARPNEIAPTATTPFVAGLSACMAVAELVKYAGAWPSILEPRFQFDCLRGPALGLTLPQARNPRCRCVERSANIEQWRASRAAGASRSTDRGRP